MITKIMRILFYPVLIVIFYTMLITFYPTIWDKIDKTIWVNFNNYLRTKSSEIVWKLNFMKSETNSVINGVWTNTKNRTSDYQKNLREIKGK